MLGPGILVEFGCLVTNMATLGGLEVPEHMLLLEHLPERFAAANHGEQKAEVQHR